MWRVAFLIATLIASCATLFAQAPSSGSTRAESPVQFLIDSAAGDFRAHHTPEPAKFRHVRVGHTTSNGATRYIMCGEFLPVVKEGKAEWMAFATVKTDPYEQYIGSQSGSFCQKPAFVQDSKADLAPQLQSKYDSLK